MTDVEDLGDQPRDLSDSSYYLTRLLNSLMADLSLKTHRGKTRNFKMTSLMTPEEHTTLCETVTIIFEKAVNHKILKANLKEFTERNKFDFYYRFLVYLHQTEESLSFNRFCLALVTLLSGSQYLLPDLYRALSVHLLAQVVKPSINPEGGSKPAASQSPSIFCALSLCRLNKFFFYTFEQKKLFTEVIEQVFINKLAHYDTSLESRLARIDGRLLSLAAGINGLLVNFDKRELQNLENASQLLDERLEKSGKKSPSPSKGRQVSGRDSSPDSRLDASKDKKPKKLQKLSKGLVSDEEGGGSLRGSPKKKDKKANRNESADKVYRSDTSRKI